MTDIIQLEQMNKALIAIAVIATGLLLSTVAPVFASDNMPTWLTTRTSGAQKTFTNSNYDSSDILIYHFGSGVTPTATQLNDFDAVTSIPDNRKYLEAFSLSDLSSYASIADTRGFAGVSYDLESISPAAEVADPVGSYIAARAIADTYGLELIAVPSNSIDNTYADDIAPYVDRYHLQSQPLQDSDTTCNTMITWMDARIADIEGANSNLVGKITGQVTLTGNAASGKTVYQTAEDCIDNAMANSNIDGMTIWWGGTTWDNGDYSTLTQYFETNYS